MAGAEEDGQEHGPGELAGVGVLQRWMIAGQQPEAAGQSILRPVAEGEAGARRDLSRAELVSQESVESDLAQANDNTKVPEQANLLIEPGRAVALLLRCRLIGRRSATDTALIQRLESLMPSSREKALACEAKPAS